MTLPLLGEAKQDELAAKDAEIASLNRHIDTLHLLTSPELLKHFEATKKLTEDLLNNLRADGASKDKEIAQLRTERQVDQSKIELLTALRSQSEELARQVENIDRRLYHGQAQIQASVSVRKSTTP